MRIRDWSSDVCSSDLKKSMSRRAAQDRADRPHDRRVIEIALIERGNKAIDELKSHWRSALAELKEAPKQNEIHALLRLPQLCNQDALQLDLDSKPLSLTEPRP